MADEFNPLDPNPNPEVDKTDFPEKADTIAKVTKLLLNAFKGKLEGRQIPNNVYNYWVKARKGLPEDVVKDVENNPSADKLNDVLYAGLYEATKKTAILMSTLGFLSSVDRSLLL